jgi:hypothetical protein
VGIFEGMLVDNHNSPTLVCPEIDRINSSVIHDIKCEQNKAIENCPIVRRSLALFSEILFYFENIFHSIISEFFRTCQPRRIDVARSRSTILIFPSSDSSSVISTYIRRN